MRSTAPPPTQPTTLYRFYDQADQLLYVGITDRGARRWNEHRKTQPWWTEVATTKTVHYDTRADALEAERQAIISEKPMHNVVHNGRRAKVADPYDDMEVGLYVKDCAAVAGTVAVGDVVAVRTQSHDYPPVGQVRAVDDHGVRLALMSFANGYFSAGEIVVMWSDIVSMLFADIEESVGGMVVYDTYPLGLFQDKHRRVAA